MKSDLKYFKILDQPELIPPGENSSFLLGGVLIYFGLYLYWRYF